METITIYRVTITRKAYRVGGAFCETQEAIYPTLAQAEFKKRNEGRPDPCWNEISAKGETLVSKNGGQFKVVETWQRRVSC